MTKDVIVDKITIELDLVKELIQKDLSEVEKELMEVSELKGIKKRSLWPKHR